MHRQQEPGQDRSPAEARAGEAAEFHKAVLEHQRGNLAAAEISYRRILARAPEHFDVLHMLGVLRHQQGQHKAAVDLIQRAIRISPDTAIAYVNLGVALQKLGRWAEALASYDRALALEPAYANALVNRGNALQDLKRPLDAVVSYDRALSLKSDHVAALFNRGIALQDLDRHEEALASYDRVLALRPDQAKALLNRGIALLDLERNEEALASFGRALALRNDYAEAFNNRGVALQALRRYEDALASFERALALNPDYVDALSNRGDALDALGRDTDALDAYVRLVERAPAHDYAIGKLHKIRMRLCNWETLAHDAATIIASANRGERAVTPFVLLATTPSAAAQFQCARTYVADKYPAARAPLWTGQRYTHEKIRVAYLSADFREHAVSYLTAGLFEKHDRKRFEPIAISFCPQNNSEMGRRVKAAFGQFIEAFGKRDRAVAELMLDLQVDIAVDLMGFTSESRTGIFARRPAPIQVNFLGFPGTMGAEYIDYIIADDFVIPRDRQAWYAEKVVYLPDTFQANDGRRTKGERAPTRLETGLPESGFVFCSFNNRRKFNPGIFDVWMRLLEKVPASVLWLVEGNVSAQDNLRHEAANRSVEPRRLIFAPELNYRDHLARLRFADLFLDTLPFNAGTTASDALWAGVPVLTCAGEAFASRMAGSLLNAVGLPELITRDLEGYEALALELATRPATLADIRAKLDRNRSTCSLFDTDRFRRHIEAAYVTMWERCQRGEPPESITVEPMA
jgi:protein O-GlcNAc transferase